jgi:hypothetical protein
MPVMKLYSFTSDAVNHLPTSFAPYKVCGAKRRLTPEVPPIETRVSSVARRCYFSTTSRPTLRPIGPPVQWVPEGRGLDVKLTIHTHVQPTCYGMLLESATEGT